MFLSRLFKKKQKEKNLFLKLDFGQVKQQSFIQEVFIKYAVGGLAKTISHVQSLNFNVSEQDDII